jgi:hypothetical protein
VLISYVLRVDHDALAAGRLVAEVEAVGSRQRFVVHSLEELTAFLVETCEHERMIAERSRPRDDFEEELA